jgi:hypothetical protein
MAMRELPFNVNVTLEQEKIEVEKMRDSLLGSLAAYTQAIPQMATQGQDPSEIVRKIAEVIQARQKGVAIEDAIQDVFAPKQQVPPAGAQPSVEQPVPAAPGVPAGGAPQIEAAPEGRPDMQELLSRMTGSGDSSASATTMQRSAI